NATRGDSGAYPASGSLQVEKGEELLARERQIAGGAGVAKDRIEEFPFFGQDLVDPLLDRSAGQESRHGDWAGAADAVGAVDGLVFDGRVPPAIEQEDIVGKLQVESDAPRAIAHQDDAAARVVAKLLDHTVAAGVWHLTVVLDRVKLGERGGKFLNR